MKAYSFISIALAGILIFTVPAWALDGPFEVRNQFPLFLPVDQPSLERATTGNSVSVSLSHSSVYVMEDAAAWSSSLDLELTELNIRLKKDFPGFFELDADLPVLRASGGFMDRPLAWYHRAFGFPDYGRNERPQNEFAYEVSKDGRPVVRGNNDKTGVGDVRIALKRKFIEDQTLVVSARFDAELPTGNAKIGYGSGSLDMGAALLLDRRIWEESALYMNIGLVVPGDLKAHQTIDLKTYYYAGAGIEYLYDASLSLILQAMVQSSSYPETGISQIDTPGILLAFGGRYYFHPGSIEFSLTEDPNTSGVPDFIFNVAYQQQF